MIVQRIATTCWLLMMVSLLALAGCVDGPMYEMKKLNPFVRAQWAKDRAIVPVYSQRIDEIRFVKERFPSMSDAEQAESVEILRKMIPGETSPEIRRETVLALAQVAQRPEAAAAIIAQSRDKNEKVRLAVARGLRERSSPEATETLLAMARTDKSQNVRLSAIESLGSHRSDEVQAFLTQQLSDRIPIVQRYATVALKVQTGKDLGEDVVQWKRYMAGEPIDEPSTSLAEVFQSVLPIRR